MFINHLKIAFRNLWNNRFFTALNLSGLSIGIAVSLALLLYVRDELTFDQYHAKKENIYRLGVNVNYKDVDEKWANVPNISGPTFKDEILEVEEQARLLHHNFGQKAFVNTADKHLVEDKIFWADPSILDILDIPVLEGNPATALDGPHKMMLSRSAAKRIFPHGSPVGKTLGIDNSLEVTVTGVFADFPANSSYDCDFIGSFKTMKWAAENLYWSNCSFETLLLLRPGADPKAVESKMGAVLDKHVKKEEQWFRFWMQPLLDIHLYSSGMASGYSVRESNATQVKVLGILALAVLLLACFNYVNMVTARSQQRFREVGINKTLGASTGQMIRRFYVETGVLVAIALVAGVLLVELSLPLFESITDRALSIGDLFGSKWAWCIPAVWLAVTLGAGMYPALYLSSFSPKSLLSPIKAGAKGNLFFRETLVIGQFAVCVALITGAIVFKQQLNFISKKDLGFQPAQVIAINTNGIREKKNLDGLMNAYRSMPGIQSQVRVQAFPGISTSGYSMSKPGESGGAYTGVSSNHAGPGFEKVLGLKLLAGTTLPEKAKEDTTVQVVMNETGARFLGYTAEEAIGKRLPDLYQGRPTTIVGVVKDFHFESLHKPIGAYVFTNGNGQGGRDYLLVKTQTSDLKGTLAQLENEFKNFIPSSAFDYTFLDEHTADQYKNEKRVSRVVSIFTMLAIFISCLGLFGLAAFTAERRTKEIGIRKVLGASVGGLVALLSKDFMKPVLTAILLAAPLAYTGMNYWLQSFAYRIEMQWWHLAIAGISAIIVAFLTVSFQSVKAALANPVKSLRSE